MECLVFGFIVFVGCVILVVAGIAYTISESKKARAAYHASLEELKSDPHDPQLREQTLALGRAYAKTTRGGQFVAIFDEVALANDINPACARAGSRVTVSRGPTVEERLTQLDALRAKGLISEPEYQSRRRQVLDEL
jgi:hypothetical protein